MVTGLQLPLKDVLPDGSASKSHSRESGTIQGLTFEGVLQSKEKHLQDAQTVSASSIAAAVAALQVQPFAKFVNETFPSQGITEGQTVLAEARTARQPQLSGTPLHQLEQSRHAIHISGTSQDAVQTSLDTGPSASAAESSAGTGKEIPEIPPEFIPTSGIGMVAQSIAESVGGASQTFTVTQPAQVSRALPEAEIKDSPGKRTHSESEKQGGRNVTRIEEYPGRPARPGSSGSPENVDTQSGYAVVVSKPVEPHTDTFAPARVAIDQNNPVVQRNVEMQFAKPQPRISLHHAAARLDVADTMPAQDPQETKSSGREFFEPEMAGSQAHNVRIFMDVSQPASQGMDISFGAHFDPAQTPDNVTDLNIKHSATNATMPEVVKTQSSMQDLAEQIYSKPETNDIGSTREKGQSIVSNPGSENLQFEVEDAGVPSIARPQPASAGMEPMQSIAQTKPPMVPLPLHDLPEVEPERAAIFAEKVFVEARQKGMQSIAYTEKPVLIPTHPDREMPSMPANSGQELPATTTEMVEAQSTAHSLAAAGIVEKKQAVSAIEVSSQSDGQRLSSHESISKFEPGEAHPASKVDAMGNSPASLQFPGQEAPLPGISFDNEAQVRPDKAGSASNSIEPANEKVKPGEKQVETRPGVDEAVNHTSPVRGSSVETVATKESGIAAKFPAAEVIQQIVRHVEARVHNRSTTVHLQLNPKELGVIDVQIVSSPQGVSLTFSAEQPATGRLLETQLSQLHQSLTEAGVQISGLNISQHGQPRQEGGFLNQTPQFTHVSQRDDSPKGASVRETRRLVQRTGATGEIDYLI